MTRRRAKSDQRSARKFREARISKLIERGWISTAAEIPRDAIPVDPDRINVGGSYFCPRFFADKNFTCHDCGAECTWKAADQQW